MGRVKTRLAAKIGDQEALNIYQKLLVFTKELVSPLQCTKAVCYSLFIAEDDIWDNTGFKKSIQRGSDLGQKMANAFEEAFNGKSSKIVLIGSDCGEITAEIIRQAFVELETNDAVLGPARDGGYYLIGLKRVLPFLFENISWSTEFVLEQTLKKLEETRLAFSFLPELNDVDTYEDWLEIKDKIPEL